MLKLISLLYITLLSYSSYAANTQVEVFTQYRNQLSTDQENSRNGWELDRLRLLYSDKITSNWSAKARVDFIDLGKSTPASIYIREAVLIGNGILTDKDQLKLGAQNHPFHAFVYPHLGTRWIMKVGGHGIWNAWSNAFSYNYKLNNKVSFRAWYGSNEGSNAKGSDDLENEVLGLINFSPLENLHFLFGYGKETTKSNVIRTAMRFESSLANLHIDYHKEDNYDNTENTAVSVQATILPQSKYQVFIGLEGEHYLPNDTSTNNEDLVARVGVTTKIQSKIDAGLFYDHTTYEKGKLATTTTNADEDSKAVVLKFAAKF